MGGFRPLGFRDAGPMALDAELVNWWYRCAGPPQKGPVGLGLQAFWGSGVEGSGFKEKGSGF